MKEGGRAVEVLYDYFFSVEEIIRYSVSPEKNGTFNSPITRYSMEAIRSPFGYWPGGGGGGFQT